MDKELWQSLTIMAHKSLQKSLLLVWNRKSRAKWQYSVITWKTLIVLCSKGITKKTKLLPQGLIYGVKKARKKMVNICLRIKFTINRRLRERSRENFKMKNWKKKIVRPLSADRQALSSKVRVEDWQVGWKIRWVECWRRLKVNRPSPSIQLINKVKKSSLY